jgi:SAM-dependent methyltransferase
MIDSNVTRKPNCIFCGESLTLYVLKNICRKGIICNVLECTDCQVAMTHPFPTDKEIDDLYSTGNYRTDVGTRFNPIVENLVYQATAVKRRRIEKYAKIGKLIDIGCGRGLFLDVMRRGGWDVVGLELNKQTASYGKRVYDLDIYAGKDVELSLESENFDVVHFCGVLEHSKKPNVLLSEAYRILKNNGLLIVLLPDIRSFEFKLGREYWLHLDLPFHLFHFTEEGLIQILRKKGFKVKNIKRFHLEYSPFGWLQTLLNLSRIRFNLLYDLLKPESFRKDKEKLVYFLGAIVTLILLPIYLPLALFLSIVEPLFFKRGSIVEIYASKEKS